MKLHRLLAAISLVLLSFSPVAVSAASYNGTTVQPNADGQTYNVSASAGDTVNLANIANTGGSVAVTFNSSVSGTIQFVPSQTLPASAPSAPAGKVATYYDVIMNGLNDSNITSATWNFGVTKSFVNSLGLSPTNVVMYHYFGGNWQALKTTHGTDDATNYNFSAVTSGFSPFAVDVVPGLSNTGFPYALTALIGAGAIAAVAGSYAVTRKKA